MTKTYAYRVIPPERIEERLNEAAKRGWELHTFCDASDETWASAVFQWRDPSSVPFGKTPSSLGPFADDDDDAEDRS